MTLVRLPVPILTSYRAVCGIEESLNELNGRTFSASARTHKSHGASTGDFQVDTVKHLGIISNGLSSLFPICLTSTSGLEG